MYGWSPDVKIFLHRRSDKFRHEDSRTESTIRGSPQETERIMLMSIWHYMFVQYLVLTCDY